MSGRAGSIWAAAPLVLSLLWSGSGWSAGDGPVWRRIADDRGVAVDQEIPSEAGVPTVRAVTDVDAALGEVLPVLLDSARHTEWMPSCVESRAVRREGDVRYVYNRSSAPWPFADRDVVLRSRVVMVEPGVEFMTPFESIDDPAVPPLADAVRVPLLRGHYRVRALSAQRTRIELVIALDPGGRIPQWVIRMVAQKNSVGLLVALRDQVQATRGSYDAFMQRFLASGDYERVAPEAAVESAGPPPGSDP